MLPANPHLVSELGASKAHPFPFLFDLLRIDSHVAIIKKFSDNARVFFTEVVSLENPYTLKINCSICKKLLDMKIEGRIVKLPDWRI